MTTMEFLQANGVRLLRADKSEAISLGLWETTENLGNVVGKIVWICDFRNSAKDILGKPIRAIAPKQVQVFDSENSKKTIYYSPICFREIGKKGKLMAAEINAVDNTGYRSIAGTSVQIFTNKEECEACCDILPRTKVRGFLPWTPGNCASMEPLAAPVLLLLHSGRCPAHRFYYIFKRGCPAWSAPSV